MSATWLLALGLAALYGAAHVCDAQTLVKADDGSGTLRMLFQTQVWPAPNIHYSAGDGWTAVPGVPMNKSTLANFSAADGWFQYELQATQLEFVFNDGDGNWDNNDNQNYKVASAGTWSVVSKITDTPTPAPSQSFVVNAGYKVTKVSKSSSSIELQLAVNALNGTETYGADIKNLVVQVSSIAEDALRVKIFDKNASRWEVPSSLYSKGALGNGQAKRNVFGSQGSLVFNYTSDPFAFSITRRAGGYVLFDSSALSLAVKDQYLQIATAVGSDISVYGVGETTHSNMRLNSGDKHTLWARDQGSNSPNVNLYGSHPFYLAMNGKGQAHGVFLLNSNGMDITLEDSFVVFQTIGGILDFHVLAGPTPAKVVAQYTSLIGRPKMQPYWSYGFHQCRWGYRSVADLRTVVDKYIENKIPLDVMWADIDYMNAYHDFTLDPVNFTKTDFQSFLSDVHAGGRRFVPIIDPGIPDDEADYAYTRGLALDVFIKDTQGKPYLGQVWPGPTVFPDFFHPQAAGYWSEQLSLLHSDIAYDGIWIDMNELANFCPGTTCVRQSNVTCPNTGSISQITTCCLACTDDTSDTLNHPPFAINNVNSRDAIFNKAISTSALQHSGIRQYDAHNLYGLTEGIATSNALETIRNKRAFVLSRSTFPGSGAYVAHWTGDNAATWNDIQWSIPTILNFGLYGIPMVGSDICGFSSNSNEELCARWTALGSFYPFARNHNNLEAISQETYVWASVAEVGRKFIGWRYRLLPYLYTLGYEAHSSGAPIARAMFYEFPLDLTTHTSPVVDNQFFLGSALLVTPVLTQGATSVTGYFPAGTWYSLFDSSKLVSSGQDATFTVSLYDMPVHIREGSVLPLHQAALTSTAAQALPFDVLVALTSAGKASGQLYLDDGESLDGVERSTIVQFAVSTNLIGTTFTSSVSQNRYSGASAKTFGKLSALGVSKKPKVVLVNAFSPITSFSYNATTQRLDVDLAKLKLRVTDRVSVLWL